VRHGGAVRARPVRRRRGQQAAAVRVLVNGRETESPSVGNKQCPGKNLVVLVGRLLVVELFLRYDSFTATVSTELLGSSVVFTGVTKATSGPGSSEQ